MTAGAVHQADLRRSCSICFRAAAPRKRAARGAIDELASSVGGRACLIVSRLDGARVLTIGDATELSSLPVPSRTSRALTMPIDLPPPYRAAIGVIRDVAPPLTRRDESLVQSTASTLAAWLPGRRPAPANRGRSPHRAGARSIKSSSSTRRC